MLIIKIEQENSLKNRFLNAINLLQYTLIVRIKIIIKGNSIMKKSFIALFLLTLNSAHLHSAALSHGYARLSDNEQSEAGETKARKKISLLRRSSAPAAKPSKKEVAEKNAEKLARRPAQADERDALRQTQIKFLVAANANLTAHNAQLVREKEETDAQNQHYVAFLLSIHDALTPYVRKK
jgi:hypothetical protein